MVIHGAWARSVAITSSRRRRYADAHLSEVSIEVTCRDEVGECRLIDGRHADAPAARLRHRLDERGRQHEPCDVQTRRERLARSASVDDATRVETLHRTHRLAVVAELTVVVVLDDPTIAPPRPLDERDSPSPAPSPLRGGIGARASRAQHALECCRGCRLAGRRHRPEPASTAEPGTCAELGMEGERGVFDRDRVEPGRAQRLREHAQCLGEATEDDDVLGIGANGAGTAEIRGKSDAELAEATRVAVAEEVVGRGAEHAADRCRPLASRERPAVGLARPEVGVVAPSLGRRAPRCGFAERDQVQPRPRACRPRGRRRAALPRRAARRRRPRSLGHNPARMRARASTAAGHLAAAARTPRRGEGRLRARPGGRGGRTA